jgi:ectoine hydroxylase-related dioxygenase (phytanoyl-CoA dioxygenase family)
MSGPTRYGVSEQTTVTTAIDAAVETIALRGYAVVDGGYAAEEIEAFAGAFDRAHRAMEERYGRAALEALDEQHVVRLPLFYDRRFVQLVTNPTVLAICRRLVGDYIVLNQQNGLVNPGGGAPYSQTRYHRDLPYQHFVSSRPLAVSALYCVDAFTLDNGATAMIPASHKQEAFPSDSLVEALSVQVLAPAGSFLVFDSMVFHAAPPNRTARDRRGVNHVYTIPLIKPLIDIAGALGESFTDDRDVRRLLGYDARVPLDIAAYYAQRRRRGQ